MSNMSSNILMMKLAISLCLLMPQHQLQAKDFGKIGMTFEIKEEGFLSMIQRKLSAIDLEAEQQKMSKLAKSRVANPLPVRGLERAKLAREFYHDPSYRVLEDIILPCGKLLHKAGTTVNPLDHITLDRKLYFIDGRDQEQVEWLKEIFETTKSETSSKVQNKVVLIGGRIFDLQQDLNMELYFDQGGVLTDKFDIRAVPAIVEQEGKNLRIQEIVINDASSQKLRSLEI